jgi:hypothetical protein
VKWPLAVLFAIAGLALAFLPYQDRPLETWALAFLHSIYSPTIYIYKKTINKNWLEIDMAKAKADEEAKQLAEVEPLIIKDKKKVSEFIMSLPSVKIRKNSEEMDEEPAEKEEPELIDTAPKLRETKENLEKPEEVEVRKPVVTEEKKEEDWRDKKTNLDLKKTKLEATANATFGDIPMPVIPDVPNMLVGMVTDTEGKIIEGAIVEIQDEKGNPSRVLKTNMLGQFRTSTELARGKYLLIVDKENYKFDRVNIEVKGEILQPIRVVAVG